MKNSIKISLAASFALLVAVACGSKKEEKIEVEDELEYVDKAMEETTDRVDELSKDVDEVEKDLKAVIEENNK